MFSSRYQRKCTSDADKRSCFICYKSTNIVLLNENPAADFFYACDSHLVDRGFCKPDEPPAAQKKLDDEISQLKKDWDANKPPPVPPRDDAKPEAEAKAEAPEAKPKTPTTPDTEPQTTPKPKWVTLDPQIHRLRLQHKSRLNRQKKNAQLLSTPMPSAPTHIPKAN